MFKVIKCIFKPWRLSWKQWLLESTDCYLAIFFVTFVVFVNNKKCSNFNSSILHDFHLGVVSSQF